MRTDTYRKLSSYLLIFCIGSAPLSACAKPSNDQKYQFAYTAGIDASGKLQVLDKNGKPLPTQRITGPVDARKIIRVRTMTIVEVEGSHYLDITIDGVPYKVMLPD